MILVIDKEKRAARNLSDALSYMGFISIGSTPSEALSEISTIYRAVIITSVEALPDAEDYVRRLRSYAKSVPIYAIFDSPEGSKYSHLFSASFKRGTYASRLAEGIIMHCDDNDLPPPGFYALAGIDISVDLRTPTYFFTPLPFTKTELMILRYLFRMYPNTVKSEKILKYAYRPSKRPDVANIRTHISIINKKFKEITGRNLVYQVFGKGYSILTPEVMESQKNEATVTI
jgi:DNA-binding response OmpR family regulator